jgi:outer membrane protein assembly factor BamD
MTKFSRSAVILSLVLLVSCSGKPAVKPSENFDAEKYFASANKLIDGKNYTEARTLLLEIKNRDLSKKYAPLAELRIADSYVKEEQPDLAISEYRKFLEMYPDHRFAAYAQYQVAMVYYGQIESPDRGYGGAAHALTEFEKLKKDFPRNPYRDIVELRIDKCRNTIAEYEYIVGEFYMKKDAYGPAVSRFEGILKNYPEYKKQEYGLLKLGAAYVKWGKKDKAEEYFKKLVEQFPTTPQASVAKKELASLSKKK